MKLSDVWSRGGPSQAAAFKLSGGSATAQLALLAVSPLLTRLFDPVQFGALATFTALTAWLVTVATGKYETAVMLPEQDEAAVELALVGLGLAVICSGLTLGGVIWWEIATSGWGTDFTYLWWLPVMVLITSANAVLVAFAGRQGEFGLVAATTATKGIVTAVAQVLGGLLRPTAPVLVGASVLGAASANLRLSRRLWRALQGSGATARGCVARAREYRRFPQHTLPAALVSATTLNGLPVAIGVIFGAATLGAWSLAQRVVGAPLALIGQAVSQVYYKRAAETRRAAGDALGLYRRYTVSLALFSMPPFILLAVLAPTLFAWVFGPEWTDAGTYARIMIPWFWARFVTSPVSQTPIVLERNRLGLAVQGPLLLIVSVAMGLGAIGWSFPTVLTILSVLSAAYYVGLLWFFARLVKQDPGLRIDDSGDQRPIAPESTEG